MQNPFPSTIQLLRTQVSTYSQSAEEDGEFWKAVREADACRDLEVVLDRGLGLYKSIRRYTDGKNIDSEVLDLVMWWLRPCERVNKRIKAFEALDYVVDGSEEFRKDWKEASELARLVPTTWRGQKIYTEKELQETDFPYPLEPE